MRTALPDLTFKSNQNRTWPDLGTQIRPSQIQIWGELVLGSQNNTPDATNGVNNAVSCYKEALQFSASFVMSLKFANWQ